MSTPQDSLPFDSIPSYFRWLKRMFVMARHVKLSPSGEPMVVHPASGSTIMRKPDGKIMVQMSCIRSVGIANVGDVLSHDIVRIVGSTSHHVRFFGGGELRFVYNTRGEVVEFSGFGIGIEVKGEGGGGRVMVSALAAAECA